MGRVLRWNSWDLVTRPDHIAGTMYGAFQDPASHSRAIVISLEVAFFLTASYVVFTLISNRLFRSLEQPNR